MSNSNNSKQQSDPNWSVISQLEMEYKPILLAIHNSEKLYITAVNGVAAGAGSGFALAGDLCVMSESAFMLEAFAAIGLVPDCGVSWHLCRQLGPKLALEMIVSGERISAERCLELGLANRVVPGEELMPTVRELASSLSKKAPLAIKYSKQLVNEVWSLNLDEAISREANYQDICINSEDADEGRQALLDKRQPVFQGK